MIFFIILRRVHQDQYYFEMISTCPRSKPTVHVLHPNKRYESRRFFSHYNIEIILTGGSIAHFQDMPQIILLLSNGTRDPRRDRDAPIPRDFKFIEGVS